MEELTLHERTLPLCLEFYRGFEQDKVLFADPALYAPYTFDAAKAEAFFLRRQSQADRQGFYILLEGRVIGDVGFKHIDRVNQSCELEICMQNDRFKNRGYGTRAELLALRYAFGPLGMQTVLADTTLQNTRSQHVLEKVGFRPTGEDKTFRYYRLTREDFNDLE